MGTQLACAMALAFLCPLSAWAQTTDVKPVVQVEESESRKELKHSVTRMTYQSGDQRLIVLPSSDGIVISETKPKQIKKKSQNPKREKKRHKPPQSISVQCSPLGEAEAIGVLTKRPKRIKKRGEPIEVHVPEDQNVDQKKWRRIAELACMENEI